MFNHVNKDNVMMENSDNWIKH